jgi:ubiquinone biosynthesis protein Coq4
LIGGFESHDLKHVLLGYEMTPVDEIRMQAFLFGNGCNSLVSFGFLLYGIILLPDQWSIFYSDFKMGLDAPRIIHLDVNSCAMMETKKLQAYILANPIIRK